MDKMEAWRDVSAYGHVGREIVHGRRMRQQPRAATGVSNTPTLQMALRMRGSGSNGRCSSFCTQTQLPASAICAGPIAALAGRVRPAATGVPGAANLACLTGCASISTATAKRLRFPSRISYPKFLRVRKCNGTAGGDAASRPCFDARPPRPLTTVERCRAQRAIPTPPLGVSFGGSARFPPGK